MSKGSWSNWCEVLPRIAALTVLLMFTCQVSYGQNRGAAAVRIGWAGAFNTETIGPTILSGQGTMISGSGEFRPTRYIGFELDASRMNRLEKSSSGQITSRGNIAFLDANVVIHPWHGRFQPYVFGGAGVTKLKEELGVAPGNTSGRVFTAGGGADIQLIRRLFVRTEARSFSTAISNRVLQLSAGLALHW